MPRKEIKGPINDETLNNMNNNFIELFKNLSNIVNIISDELYQQLIDSMRFKWRGPVDFYEDLPSQASEGETRQVLYEDNDKNPSGKVYRYTNGEWRLVQQIDAGPLNQLDTRVANVSKNTPAVISFMHDDGFQEDDLTYRIFKEYGLTCGFAIITDRILHANKNPIEKYRQYQREGFSILSHSANHQAMSNEDMSINQADYEINHSFKDLSVLGFDVDGFVTPMSTLNDKYIDLLKDNYSYAYTRFTGNLPADNRGHAFKDADVMRLGRVSLLNNSEEKIKEAIDNAIREKGFLAFYEHRTGHPDWISEEKLRTVLSYVKQKTENDDCLVLNPDDAVRYYFGKSNRSKYTSRNLIQANLSPGTDKVINSNSADYGTWIFSNHQTSQGENARPATVNAPYTEVNYPNGANSGTIDSLQTKIYVATIDKSNAKNRSLYFSTELWSNNADLFDVELRCRFYRSNGSFANNHVYPVTINPNKSRVEAVFSIANETDLSVEYALVYVQFRAKSNLPSNTKVYFAEPVIGIGTDATENTARINDPFTITLQSEVERGENLGNRVWHKYASSVNNRFMNGLNDGTGTLLIKETGLYSLNFNFNLEVAGSTQTNYPRMMLEVSTTPNFGGDTPSRSYHYYTKPDDVFSVISNYTLWLKAGDKVSVKLWFDSANGTCIEMMDSMCRILKLS